LEVRRRNGGSRAFKRRLNNGFPYHRLSQFIEYKAKWHEIKVLKISHKCGHRGIRVGSLFKCPNCGYQCNTDYNGAMNILKRGMDYMLMPGAALAQPRTRYDERLQP
ncbi:MAG: zinc ribbon domain-containing protein, partial [Nitrososphaeria archaeon]